MYFSWQIQLWCWEDNSARRSRDAKERWKSRRNNRCERKSSKKNQRSFFPHFRLGNFLEFFSFFFPLAQQKLGSASYARLIGYVEQSDVHWPHSTVLEALHFAVRMTSSLRHRSSHFLFRRPNRDCRVRIQRNK